MKLAHKVAYLPDFIAFAIVFSHQAAGEDEDYEAEDEEDEEDTLAEAEVRVSA